MDLLKKQKVNSQVFMKKSNLPKDIQALSSFLDTRFKGPFNINFGLDSIIGLIPVWGDLVSLILSHYIILRSISLKCSKRLIFRMIFNAYIDFLVGSIPVIGDIFDFYWKANEKNKFLLENHLSKPEKEDASPTIVIYVISGLLIIFLILSLYKLFSTV